MSEQTDVEMGLFDMGWGDCHTVSVTGLAGKVAFLIRSVTHVKWIIPHNLTYTVVGNVVAALRLVDADFAVRGHVMEILVAVDTGFLRRGP